MKRQVILVAAPWGRADYPSVQAGILKSFLSAHGVSCEIFEANRALVKLIGEELYMKAANCLHPVLSEALWAEHFSWKGTESRLLDVFCMEDGEFDANELKAVREGIRAYLPLYLEARDWTTYDCVGFTCTFNQLCASLVLARHIRKLDSRPRLVFGGFNLVGQMGRHFLQRHDCVDTVISGPGEEVFLELLQLPSCDGKTFIEGTRKEYRVSKPDYSEYRWQPPPGKKKDRTFLLSASSGCDYGQCAFCSQNSHHGYHLFQKESILEAVRTLREEEPCCRIEFTDTCFPLSLINEEWVSRWPSTKGTFFAQIRPPLDAKSAYLSKMGGFEGFQVGIETFHSSISKRMKKTNDLLANVLTLKSSYENDLDISYNLLLDFPSTTNAELQEMMTTIPLLYHLSPPVSLIPFQLQYNSNIYKYPKRYGITDVQPHHYYSIFVELGHRDTLFPFYFDFSQKYNLDMDSLEHIDRLCRRWYEVYDPEFSVLAFRCDESGMVIIDRRGFHKEYRLSEAESQLLLACRVPLTSNEISSASFPGSSPVFEVESLMKKGLLLRDLDRFLALPVEWKKHSLRRPETLNSYFFGP